jgi:clan AA aspartic protease
MNGWVDLQDRALLTVEVRPAQAAPALSLEAWIDTGFTGELVMPRSQIEGLNLKRGLMVNAILGDGRKSRMDTFAAWIDWFGELREVEVIASEGRSTLLGVGLMLSHRLVVDYSMLQVTLD